MKLNLFVGKLFGISMFSLKKEGNLFRSLLPAFPMIAIFLTCTVIAINCLIEDTTTISNYMDIGYIFYFMETVLGVLIRIPNYGLKRNNFRKAILKLSKLNAVLHLKSGRSSLKMRAFIAIFLITFTFLYVTLAFKGHQSQIMRMLVQFIYLVIEFQETALMYSMLSRLNNQYREINRRLNCVIRYCNVQDGLAKHEMAHFIGEIYRLGKIHRKVSKTAQITNNVFGIPLLSMFGIRFTLLIFHGHILSHIIFNTFYFVSFLIILLVYTHYSFLIYWWVKNSNEATSTIALVHQIWNSLDFAETTILQVIVVQLSNDRPIFTGSGFFKIDWPIIIFITGAVTTYISIIIQFEIAASVSNNSTIAHFHHHHHSH